MITRSELAYLATQGIHLPPGTMYADSPEAVRFAMDAQSPTVFSQNAGVPWQLTNIIDTEVIRALVTPMKAGVILGGETGKGDWTTLSTQFPATESAGFTSSYGDFSNDGNVGANFNWIPRQSYAFQTVTQWGERELALYGTAAIDYSTELNLATALVHNKFMNKSYFYGIGGLQNFGLLNDPSLSAAITPTTKAATGTAWTSALPQEINADIQLLYSQLQTQLGGNLSLDSEMVLAMSPASEVFLLNTNSFAVSVRDLLRKNFPNMRIETAPEYGTVGGNLVQLIVQNIDGIRTGMAAFTEKLRAHMLVPDLSSWRQKKSGGTWGVVIKRPLAIAQMLGV
jgi:hypothetical protein